MSRCNSIILAILLSCAALAVFSPAQARFLQTDPVGYAGDIDWYTYAQNDPTDKTDPTGKDTIYCNATGCWVVRDNSGQTKIYQWHDRHDQNGKETGYWESKGTNNRFNDSDGHLDVSALQTALQAAMSVGPGAPGNRNGASQNGENRQDLKPLHSEEAMRGNLSSRNFWSNKSNQEIIDLLRPGQRDSLKVKPDGTIMDGNTRIQILRERGVDVNSLPREPYNGQPPGD